MTHEVAVRKALAGKDLLQGIQLLPGILQLPAGLGVAAVQVLAGQLAVELLLGLKGIPPALKVGLPGL